MPRSCQTSRAFDTAERMALPRRAVAAAIVAACGAACVMHEPGTSLGTFAVTGTLDKQSCGSGVTPDNPWKFNVRLSRGSNILYWLQDSAPPVSGYIDPQGDAVITSSSTYDLQDADGGVPYCGVVRTDKFTAALGTGTVTSFSGTAPTAPACCRRRATGPCRATCPTSSLQHARAPEHSRSVRRAGIWPSVKPGVRFES
jgi:hypothetical protein